VRIEPLTYFQKNGVAARSAFYNLRLHQSLLFGIKIRLYKKLLRFETCLCSPLLFFTQLYIKPFFNVAVKALFWEILAQINTAKSGI
jgi:hypothetical protein